MATLGVLRKTAKDLGISASDIRSATSAGELNALIVEHLNGDGSEKPSKRVATRKSTVTKATPARRGRPPKAAAVKSKPAAKSATGKAKRSTADSGRHMLGDVDYNVTDNWNARPGTAPDLIVKALRKYKGDRSKVFNALVPKLWDFVGRKMADGSKRTQASAETMLQYRISRTAWDFAMKTGQHQKSENRAEYGTQGTYKKAGATKAAGTRRTAAKAKATSGATRKAATRQKPAQKPAAAPKRRGRPPGSKNRPKVGTTVSKAVAKRPVAKKKR